MEAFQHYQYLTEVKNKSGEWHKTTQKCLKDKHVNKDVANVWERGELPHRLEDSRIVIALLDWVIRMKENQQKNYVSCLMYPAVSMMTKKNETVSQSARYHIIKKTFLKGQ